MSPIDKPGIYEMTPQEYHADPCAVPSLSSTIAKLLVHRSPKHGWLAHPKLGGLKPDDDDSDDSDAGKTTKEKELGELIHRIMLNKGGDIVVINADSFRSNAAKAERAFARMRGNIPVLSHKLPAAEAAAKSAREQLDALGLDYVFRDGRMEVVIVWQEDNGTWCRAMMDQLLIDEDTKTAEIYDLKTVGRSSHPEACGSQIDKLGYDLSLAFYRRGLVKLRPDLSGRVKNRWAFMEILPPYAVTPIEISAEWEVIASHNCERAIITWHECITTGKWPYYVSGLTRLEPKPWKMADLLSGEPV